MNNVNGNSLKEEYNTAGAKSTSLDESTSNKHGLKS